MIKKFYRICSIALLVAVMLTACGGPAATPAAVATAVPPTAIPATSVPPTAVPPTAVPPTEKPVEAAPTEVPPTEVPEFITVIDDTGAFQASVPGTWTEVDGSPMTDTYPSAVIRVAPSLSELDNYTGPGAYMMASSTLAQAGGYIEILDIWREVWGKDCKFDSRNDYSDSKYEGKIDLFTACAGLENDVLLILVARPKDNPTGHIVTLVINFPEVTDSATEQAMAILDTFDVVGELPK
jgi:hypothetical protein